MQLISGFAAAMLCMQLVHGRPDGTLSKASPAAQNGSSIPVSVAATYPVVNSVPPIILVDRTSHAYAQRQDPLRSLQGLFLISGVVCAKPRMTVITAQETIETKAMRMLIVPAGGLTWATVCDAVRGMGEYVAEKNLWYKLSFNIVASAGGGQTGRRYGTMLTETVDPEASQGAADGMEGDTTAKRRGLGGSGE